jgi:hypothetical protein
MMTGDWIDALFADDLLSWRTYLYTQLERVCFDRMKEAIYRDKIKTGDKSDLRKITDEFAELLPSMDTRVQFNKHMRESKYGL